MKQLKLISAMMLLAGALPVFALSAGPFAGGTGTKENPWQIATTAQLDSVRHYLYGHYILLNDLDFSAADFAAGGAFYNEGMGWEPIGTSEEPFVGGLDGDGHAIQNLYINRTTSDYVGFFGYTEGATITDLGIVDCNIFGSDTTGALSGSNTGAHITNTYVTGSVSGGDYVGGLTGYDMASTFSECYTASSVSGKLSVGGLIGSANSSILSYCYATGSTSGNEYVGGLAGRISTSRITDCYAAGSISGNAHVGGIAGSDTYSTMSNLYYDTETTGQNTGIAVVEGKAAANVTGLSSAAMKQESSFEDWDFSEVWMITEGETYPLLRSVVNLSVTPVSSSSSTAESSSSSVESSSSEESSSSVAESSSSSGEESSSSETPVSSSSEVASSSSSETPVSSSSEVASSSSEATLSSSSEEGGVSSSSVAETSSSSEAGTSSGTETESSSSTGDESSSSEETPVSSSSEVASSSSEATLSSSSEEGGVSSSSVTAPSSSSEAGTSSGTETESSSSTGDESSSSEEETMPIGEMTPQYVDHLQVQVQHRTLTLTYDVSSGGVVAVKLYNVLGGESLRMSQGQRTAGSYQWVQDVGSLPSGRYVCVLSRNGRPVAQKLIVLR